MQVKPPSPKTIMRAILCRLGRLSSRRTRIGRRPTAISVPMFMPREGCPTSAHTDEVYSLDTLTGIREPIMVSQSNSVEYRHDSPHSKPIQASPSCRILHLRPEVRDRPACKDCTEESPACIDSHHAHHDITGSPEVDLWKDPKVLEQNRELGARHRQIVDPDGDVERFLRLDGFVEGEGVDVLAHAPFDCSGC
jgi:hypothetical protein